MTQGKPTVRFALPLQMAMVEENAPQYPALDLITPRAMMQFAEDGNEYEVSLDTMACVEYLDKGTYGTVSKYQHRPSGYTMAVKRILFNNDNSDNPAEMRKRLFMDVSVSQRIMSQSRQERCPYLIRSFGTILTENEVWICMELMDISLEKFYKKVYKLGHRLPEPVIASIIYAVICGLSFLKDYFVIMHRDIKPSNILLSKNGDVKICDFGISAELERSRTRSNIGCQFYKAPERVDPDSTNCPVEGFDVRTDIWSLGITAMELAMGDLPFKNKSLFGVIQEILHPIPPTLPSTAPYSPELRDFVNACCRRDYQERPRYADLMKMPFVAQEAATRHDISGYVQQVMDIPVTNSV